MPRRQTYRRTCAHLGCTESSLIEYTARRELDGISPTWKCTRHAQPDRVLSTENPETTAVLVLQPNYIDGYRRTDPPRLTGYSWRPEDAKSGSGFVSGPGYLAHAEDFPPGTRLVITARIELPDTPDPICGDRNDDEVCELAPHADGDHRNGDATVSWPAAPAA